MNSDPLTRAIEQSTDAMWTIEGDILALLTHDSAPVVPTALEVFNCEFRHAGTVCGYRVRARPSEVIEGIGFSKYPVPVQIILEAGDRETSHPIRYFVVAGRGDELTVLDGVGDSTPDHLIIGQTWYPLMPGAVDQITQALADAEATPDGGLSLRGYLAVREAGSETGLVDDRVDQSFSNKASGLSAASLPAGFTGTLYPYQATGYSWLLSLADENIGSIVADEMGLGKTIQVLAFLAREVQEGRRPSLVVAPATLLENWRREAEKFAPHLSVLVHRGSGRPAFPRILKAHDLVVTSYETAVRDLSLLQMVDWNAVVLDEAQAIKSPGALRTKTVKQLNRRLSVAMTGTPVENSLSDLWSITDFIWPGFLGTLAEFEAYYEDNVLDAARLEPVISPLMLRREVDEVAGDLPERIDIPQAIELTGRLARGYEAIREQLIEENSGSFGLGTLVKLRMYCTHPFLLGETGHDPSLVSPKYVRLSEILAEIASRNEKALVFTEYTQMIDILLADIPRRLGMHCDWIDGRVDVDDRAPKLDAFEAWPGPAVLALNPCAAGTGLNITAANHVIHYNLVWNPAVEDQASARAYRRGQTRPVTVHELFYANTVEEVVFERLARKRALAEQAVVGTDGEADSHEDILKAINISPVSGG